MTIEKIEAIKKVSETTPSNPSSSVNNATGMDPHEKSQFQSFVDSSKSIQPSLQPLNKSFQNQVQIQQESIQPTHQNPVFAEESSSAQKHESATDQDQKQKKRRQTEEDQTVGGVTGTKPKVPNSLIQEMQNLNTQVSQISKTSRLKPDDLREQAKGIIAQIEQAKTQLSEAQGEIKPAYQTVLRNRLTHIDDNLKIALSKAGVEYTPPPLASVGSNSASPIKRFIGYLSTSQYQLEHLHQTIEQLSLADANNLTPGSMLTLQMKMNMVSQQMELFTSLLNKALESTKTIMNVQV
jgi:hypothetical protein